FENRCIGLPQSFHPDMDTANEHAFLPVRCRHPKGRHNRVRSSVCRPEKAGPKGEHQRHHGLCTTHGQTNATAIATDGRNSILGQCPCPPQPQSTSPPPPSKSPAPSSAPPSSSTA